LELGYSVNLAFYSMAHEVSSEALRAISEWIVAQLTTV